MPRKRSKRTRLGLRFIADVTLRKKVEDAIETTSFLYLKRNEKGTSAGFAKEIRRTEILYAASIIEAVLIYLFKQRKDSLIKTDYKHVHVLPKTYQSASTSLLVLARQVQVSKLDRELTLDGLLDLYTNNGLIKKRLRDKIDRAREVRNTFHLAKSRKGIRCDAVSVNSAYDAVIEIFGVVRTALVQVRSNDIPLPPTSASAPPSSFRQQL